ncbi:hypothetical protein [Bacillus dakarensis]|nr:hypothetical protein [Bacillus dakarensis]
MEQKHINHPFPGQETGIIRILIKQSEHEESFQLSLDLFDEEQNEDS